jgi:tetratricopeptide (TPR) repeat protein
MEAGVILKSLSAIPTMLWGLAKPKVERSQLVIGTLKGSGFELLKPDFESIYAHALVEYATNVEIGQNQAKRLWVEFFSLKEVSEYIKAHLFKKPDESLQTAFDGVLHTQQGKLFLELKKINAQTVTVWAEYQQLHKYLVEFTKKTKNPEQAQNTQLSQTILEEIKNLQNQLISLKAQDSETVKISFASEEILLKINQLNEFNQANADKMDLILAKLKADNHPIMQQFAEKIYNINNANDATFIAEIQNINIENQTVINEADKPPKHLTTPPFQPEVFLGREDDLEALYNILFDNSNSSSGGKGADHILLLVNGQGGIGKTSLASKYYQQYQAKYHHLAWLLAEPSILEAILQLARPLKIDFPNEMPNEERLNELLREMANLDKPCLLILDNANDLSDLEKHYLILKKCANFHLLLTSRINEYEGANTYKVGALNKTDALTMFKKYYPKHQAEEDILLENIYEAVGGNTLVLEILAKHLALSNKLKTNYSLQALYTDISQKGLLQVQGKALAVAWQAKDTALNKATPEELLSAIYDLSELTETEIALLSVLAVLPPENITFSSLEILLKSEDLEETLLSLNQQGWLDYNEADTSFRCSPVVQEITRTKNQNRLWQACESLVSNLNDELHPDNIHIENFKYSSLYVRYAESILDYFKDIQYNLALLSERVGTYYTTIGNLENAFAYFEQCKNIAEKLVELEPNEPINKNELAISYSKLGETHTKLGNLDKALEFFEEETQLFEELYAAYPTQVSFKNGLAISYSKLGETHTKLGNLDKALQFFEERSRLGKELYEAYPNQVSFKNGLAISYSKLGDTHTNLGNLDKALEFFEEETQLFEELYAAYPNHVEFKNGLAISYEKLGDTHTKLGNLDKALEFFEEETQLFEELYAAYPNQVSFKNGLAISYEKLGDTHTKLGNLDKALEFFEEETQLFEELYEAYPNQVSFKNGLAISYSKLGATHTKLGNLDKALQFFEEETQLFEELYAAYPNQVDYKNNLAISYSKLGETHTNLGNLDKALQFFEEFTNLMKELYAAYPNQVGFKNGLAISYEKLGATHTKLGNLDKALQFFEEDIKLTKELYEAYPNQVSFKNGLAISYIQLGYHAELMKNLNQAKNYYKQCEQLYLELVRDFPAYIEFQRNLQWVQNRLAGL